MLKCILITLLILVITVSSSRYESTYPFHSGPDYCPLEKRKWVFAAPPRGNSLQLLNDDGKPSGLIVDLIHALCREARRDCAVIELEAKSCWTSEGRSEALFDQWVDGCGIYSETRQRANKFAFSESLLGPLKSELVQLKTNNHRLYDLRHLTAGMVDGWASGEACLESNGIKFRRIVTLNGPDELEEKLLNGEVDVAFIVQNHIVGPRFKPVSGSVGQACTLANSGTGIMMTHQTSPALLKWLNPAIRRIKANGKMRRICDRYETAGQECDLPRRRSNRH